MSDEQLRAWFAALQDVQDIETWISTDQRPGRTEQWLNALITRATVAKSRLVTGGDDPFLPHLSTAINQASEIDLAVAFIKTTGIGWRFFVRINLRWNTSPHA